VPAMWNILNVDYAELRQHNYFLVTNCSETSSKTIPTNNNFFTGGLLYYS
jgi:hypothetical protein